MANEVVVQWSMNESERREFDSRRAAVRFVMEELESCPYRKSSPGILVMETAKDWTAKNVSSALYPARYRRILAQ